MAEKVNAYKSLVKLIKKLPVPKEYLYRIAVALKILNVNLAFNVLARGRLEAHPMHHLFIPRLCKNVLNKSDFVFCDIGANRGVFSRRVLKYCADIEIRLFEPQRSNHARLQDLVAEYSNVSLHGIGVGAEVAELEFTQHGNDGLSSFKDLPDGVYGKHQDGANQRIKYPVHVSTLDIELAGVTNKHIFLKIDVQGFEREVLAGATQLFSENRISGILIELMTVSKYGNDTYEYFINLLSGYGFVLADLHLGFRDYKTDLLDEFDVLFLHKDLITELSLVGDGT